jgi:hypothetical protein
MAAAGKWKIYDVAKRYLTDGTHDLDDATYKIALFLSTSNANTLTHATPTLATLTNQHATANGYPAGGVAITGNTVVNAAGTLTFDCNDPVFTASGGSITARFAVIYRAGTFNGVTNPLLCVCLLDTAPADVTVTDTNTLTIVMNASGVFTLAGANVD